MKIVQGPQLGAELGSEPVLHNSLINLPPVTVHTVCSNFLPSPTPIQNPTCIYKLIHRAAVTAMNLWIRSTGSNCNLQTILWSCFKSHTMKSKPDVIYPSRMAIQPPAGVERWNLQRRALSALKHPTPAFPKASPQFSSSTACRILFGLW